MPGAPSVFTKLRPIVHAIQLQQIEAEYEDAVASIPRSHLAA
jgi:hypothetical protein